MRQAVISPNRSARQMFLDLIYSFDQEEDEEEYECDEIDEEDEIDDYYEVDEEYAAYINSYFIDVRAENPKLYECYISLLCSDAYRMLTYETENGGELSECGVIMLDKLKKITSTNEALAIAEEDVNFLCNLVSCSEGYTVCTDDDFDNRYFIKETLHLSPTLRKICPYIIMDDIEGMYPYTMDELDMIYDDFKKDVEEEDALNQIYKSALYDILDLLIDTDYDNYQALINELFTGCYKYMKYMNRNIKISDIDVLDKLFMGLYESKEDIAAISKKKKNYINIILENYIEYKTSGVNKANIEAHFQKKKIKKEK